VGRTRVAKRDRFYELLAAIAPNLQRYVDGDIAARVSKPPYVGVTVDGRAGHECRLGLEKFVNPHVRLSPRFATAETWVDSGLDC
jgi:hypothetical protein